MSCIHISFCHQLWISYSRGLVGVTLRSTTGYTETSDTRSRQSPRINSQLTRRRSVCPVESTDCTVLSIPKLTRSSTWTCFRPRRKRRYDGLWTSYAAAINATMCRLSWTTRTISVRFSPKLDTDFRQSRMGIGPLSNVSPEKYKPEHYRSHIVIVPRVTVGVAHGLEPSPPGGTRVPTYGT